MANWKKVIVSGSAPELASVVLDTDLAVLHGGTGASSQAGARTNLGLVIGTNVQAYDTDLTDIAALAKTNGNFIVGDGSNFVAESGDTAATSLGLGAASAASFGTVTTTGNIVSTGGVGTKISGSINSTGSFGLLQGDGSGITNLTSAAISTYTNGGTSDRILTSNGSSAVNAEATLTHDGSTFTVTGAQSISGNLLSTGGVGTKISGSIHSTGSFGRVEATKFVGDGSGLTGVAQDIDALDPYGAATLHQTQDKFQVSDNGTEKSITFSNLEDSIFANVTGGDVHIAAGGVATIQGTSVETSMIANDAIDGTKLADDAVNSEHITNASIDTAHIGNDQITNALMADDAIDSAQLAAASVDLAHMSVNSIDSDQYVDLSIDTIHIRDLQVTTDKLAADAITSAKIADDQVDTEHLANDAIETAAIANLQVTKEKVANSTLTGNQFHADVAGSGIALSGAALSVNFSELVAATPTFQDLTITGDLTVSGTTTTLDTQNLLVEDNFIFAGTGSAGNSWDGGLIVQSGSADKSGSAIYSDSSEHRWAVAKGVQASGSNTVVPEAFVGTVNIDQATNPNSTSGSYGEGEMYITAADDIWIRVG